MRILVTLPEELVNEMDDKVEALGLPSRNALLVQVIRKYLGHPNLFDEKEDKIDEYTG